MQPRSGSAAIRSFSITFKPTGDNSRLACGSQILAPEIDCHRLQNLGPRRISLRKEFDLTILGGCAQRNIEALAKEAEAWFPGSVIPCFHIR
jgi:hypothetical protein